MNDRDKTYVIESKTAYSIIDNKNASEYSIEIQKAKINIPKTIEDEINKIWEKCEKSKINSGEPSIVYLSSYRPQCDIGFLEKIRYALSFGRYNYFNKYPCLAESNNLIALRSICTIVTSDNILVFGLKEKESKEIVSFSDYIYENYFEDGEINIYGHLISIVCDYFALTKECIKSVQKIGQSYSERNNPINEENRGKTFNNNFVIKLNITFDILIEKLQCNYCKENIIKLMLKNDSVNQWLNIGTNNISFDCVAAIYNSFMYSNKIREAIQINKAYKKNLRVRVDGKNQSGTLYDIFKSLRIFKWGLFGNGKINNYSLAPAMWEELFKYLNYPVNYFTINEDDEKKMVEKLKRTIKDFSFLGCNIAMPWKSIAYEQCESTSTIVSELKAVNTLIKRGGIIRGYNTDGIGLVNSIKQVTSIFSKNVLIMGAGGACQTLPYYLLKSNVGSVYICDTIVQKAYNLEEKYNDSYNNENKKIYSVRHSDIPNIINKIDILINATPCGMFGYDDEIALSKELITNLKPSAVIAEMVYNPYRTTLLELVAHKHLVCEGVSMLVEQAAVSFYHGFGIELSNKTKELMKEFALSELKKRYGLIA